MMVKPLSGCVFKQHMSWTYYKLGGWLTLESDIVGGVQYFLFCMFSIKENAAFL